MITFVGIFMQNCHKIKLNAKHTVLLLHSIPHSLMWSELTLSELFNFVYFTNPHEFHTLTIPTKQDSVVLFFRRHWKLSDGKAKNSCDSAGLVGLAATSAQIHYSTIARDIFFVPVIFLWCTISLLWAISNFGNFQETKLQ